MEVTLLGMVTEVRPLQPKKASSGSWYSDLPLSRSSMRRRPRKQGAYIVVANEVHAPMASYSVGFVGSNGLIHADRKFKLQDDTLKDRPFGEWR